MKNKGQFQKGYTWRKPKPFWNKEWLLSEYAIKSATDIAKDKDVIKIIFTFGLVNTISKLGIYLKQEK